MNLEKTIIGPRVLRVSCMALMLSSSAILTASAQAGEAFSLGRYVPADSVFYYHSAHNPKSEFIGKHWAGVFEAVCDSGIDQDLKNLMLSKVPDEDRQKISQSWDDMVGRVGDVNWSSLSGKEMAAYARLSTPEFAVLFHPDPESMDANLTALKALMKSLADLQPGEVGVAESSEGAAKMWTLTGTPAPLSLVHQGSTIGLVVGLEGPQGLLRMLGDDAGSASIATSARLKGALEGLPKPDDNIFFFDVNNVMSAMRGWMTQMGAAPEGQPVPDEFKMVQTLFDQFDIVDYIAAVDRTEGLAYLSHSRVQLKEGGASSPLVKAITANKPIEDFGSYVPEKAKGFTSWSGVDLDILYKYIQDFVRDNVPQGEQKLTEWASMQEEIGFNVQDDLISWVDGRMLSVTMPPAVQTAMPSDDFVLMTKVRDAAKAGTQIEEWLERINGMLGDSGQQLILAPATQVEAEGFKSISHPMLAMMMMSFTYGVQDDWLILSNSPAAINQCLAVAKGSGKRFVDGEQLKAEGLSPKKPSDVSFTDLSNLGTELSMGLQMTNMFMMMIPPQETEARAIFSMLSKMSGPAAKLNFMMSSASSSQFNGDSWSVVTKTTYKEYDPEVEQAKLPKAKKNSIDGL